MTESTDSNDSNPRLTSQQETALDLLAMGETISATAKKVRCADQTVREWLNYDPEFYCALEARRAEAFQLSVLRLRSLVPKAIDVLEKHLKGASAVQAATQILTLAGLHNAPAPLNPDDLPAVKQGRAERDQMRRMIMERGHRRHERSRD